MRSPGRHERASQRKVASVDAGRRRLQRVLCSHGCSIAGICGVVTADGNTNERASELSRFVRTACKSEICSRRSQSGTKTAASTTRLSLFF